MKFILVVILFYGLMNSCSKENTGIKEEKPIQIQKFRRNFQGKGVVKAKYDKGRYLVLLEKLSALERCPGERTVELLDTSGKTVFSFSNNSSAIIDADFHNDYLYIASLTTIGNNESVIMDKYDRRGQKICTATVLTENSANEVYDDRVRLAVCEQNIYVAIFKNDQTTCLYALDINDLHENWPLLVEPDAHRMPWAMNGGSYDDFGQMAHQYTVYLDTDEAGNAYVGIPVMGGLFSTTVTFHNEYFGESLTLKSGNSGNNILATDAIITKVSPGGQRIYSSVMGTTYHDEIHGMKVIKDKIITYGRCPITGFNDWDPYVAVYNTSTGNELFVQNYDLGSNGLFFAAGYDTITNTVYLGGTSDWMQNPSGVSVSEEGNKLLVKVNDQVGTIDENITLTNNLRQNQIRSIQILGNNLYLLAGWENGPGTHSGDSNPALVVADGFLEVR